jgi:hypothetical protein
VAIRRICLIYGFIGLLLAGGFGDLGGWGNVDPARAGAAQTTPADTGTSLAQAADDFPAFPRQPGEFLTLVSPKRQPQDLELVSVPVRDVPTIDGYADERVWEAATAITTLDFSSQRQVTLKAVHTAEQIFILATYRDQAPSETHRSWGWDTKEEIYKQVNDREDVFVFKWSMVGNYVSLAFRDAELHRADIWYWKGRRTNPSGYADDKWQILSTEAHVKAKKIRVSTHGARYLRRLGDAGQSAYEEKLFFVYQGKVVPRFYIREPQGSRADVRAKGHWHAGEWTIEFSRRLDTGNPDDVALQPGGVYLFAISCYEMADDDVHPEWTQPLYKTGDAFDRLFLRVTQESSR